jgi:hypothetical protein
VSFTPDPDDFVTPEAWAAAMTEIFNEVNDVLNVHLHGYRETIEHCTKVGRAIGMDADGLNYATRAGTVDAIYSTFNKLCTDDCDGHCNHKLSMLFESAMHRVVSLEEQLHAVLIDRSAE